MKHDENKNSAHMPINELMNHPIRLGDAFRMIERLNIQPRLPVLAALPAAAASGLGKELGKEAIKAGVSTLVGWLCGKGLEAGESAASQDSTRNWREENFDEIVLDDGPGGGYIWDGSAPCFGRISHSWPGCCPEDQPDKGYELKVNVEVNDRTHEYFETESGVKHIELNVHRINDREKNDVDTQQVDSKHCAWGKKGLKDDSFDDIELKGCVPCSFLKNVDEVTVSIKVVDWSGNIRIKTQTYTVPKELKCC